MSNDYGPSIIINGLRVLLDAANPRSYPGSGTTWSDISRSGNTGTLVGSPTYSATDSMGAFTFNGSSQYATLTTNFFNHDSGSPFTVMCWFRTSANGIIFGQTNTATPASGAAFVPAIFVNSSGNLVTSCFWGGASANRSTSSFTVNDGIWRHVAVSFQSTNHSSYINGQLFDTISKTQTTFSATYHYYLGVGMINTGWSNPIPSLYFNGSIASFSFYNVALPEAEIRQNFNATRGRFGV